MDVHFVRAASDRGPVEKYIGAVDAIRKTRKKHWWTRTRFLLVLDDDHVYKRHIVERYAAALRAEPDTVFTVQSPPSQFIGWRPHMPIAYGARGVGMRLDLALDGALSEYAATAFSKEPTCRVVDDIVVSAFFASRNVTVRDVPYFSFDNRPWRHSHYMHWHSQQHALRSDKRDAQNARCHDALVGRDATTPAQNAVVAPPEASQHTLDRRVAAVAPAGAARVPRRAHTTAAHATAKHAKKRRNSIRHHV